MARRLLNKVGLITGGASGIGAAHAQVFAQEGAKVLLCDVDESSGRRVAQHIQSQGGEAVFFRLDVTCPDMEVPFPHYTRGYSASGDQS